MMAFIMFIDADIRHRMTPLGLLYCKTMTFISKIKIQIITKLSLQIKISTEAISVYQFSP